MIWRYFSLNIFYLLTFEHGNTLKIYLSFLDTFAKLRKATISFVMPVRMEELGSQWTDFYET